MLRICVLGWLCLVAAEAQSAVKLSPVFSDHMVLQRDVQIPVWGWADPQESVTVEFQGQSKSAAADASGKWMVRLDPLPANAKPAVLKARSAKGGDAVEVTDVLVGEVWLGSGQSNMAMTVDRAKDFEQESAAANHPLIRMFTERSSGAFEPQAKAAGDWVVCTPQSVGKFSATLYFFGREIQRDLRVPVGLINSSVGGTPIESWIALDAQKSSKELEPLVSTLVKDEAAFDEAKAKAEYEKNLERWEKQVEKAKAENRPRPRKPTDPVATRSRRGGPGGLFNGKIAPLIPYAIRGVLWYQGEANSVPSKASYYQFQLPLLVTDWRQRWGSELPFAWAQLPNFGGPGRDWPTVREAMLKTLKLPRTGMGINIDIGEEKDIHPKNKQDVGKRLAMWALAAVYQRPNVAASGPLPAGHEFRGREAVVTFKHSDGGLKADGDVQGFQLAGKDQQWKPASARIDGDKVIVTSPDVEQPVAVRYAWSNFPTCNLKNGAELPATPFRTDDWKTEAAQ
jgi:sialate O-acetylesterase